MHFLTRLLSLAVLICAFSVVAFAQRFEIDPYVGGFFSGKAAHILDVKNQPMYGVKAGWFANQNFEIEGHFGYINDLSYQGTLTRKRAYIWEGLATYNLSKFYASYGLGGVTTTVSEASLDF